MVGFPRQKRIATMVNLLQIQSKKSSRQWLDFSDKKGISDVLHGKISLKQRFYFPYKRGLQNLLKFQAKKSLKQRLVV